MGNVHVQRSLPVGAVAQLHGAVSSPNSGDCAPIGRWLRNSQAIQLSSLPLTSHHYVRDGKLLNPLDLKAINTYCCSKAIKQTAM